MKFFLALFVLALTASAARSDSVPTLQFEMISDSIFFGGPGHSDYILDGADGTLSGQSGYEFLRPVGPIGSGATTSIDINIASDAGSVSGLLDGVLYQYGPVACIAYGDLGASSVTLPVETPTSTNWTVTVPGGGYMSGYLVSGSCDYAINLYRLEVTASGLVTLIFQPIDQNQGWQLIEADFVASPDPPAPEPRTLSLACVALLLLTLAGFLRPFTRRNASS